MYYEEHWTLCLCGGLTYGQSSALVLMDPSRHNTHLQGIGGTLLYRHQGAGGEGESGPVHDNCQQSVLPDEKDMLTLLLLSAG